MNLEEYKGKKIGVLGLGVTGKSVINALRNIQSKIYAWDDNPIGRARVAEEFSNVLVIPTEGNWKKLDMIVVSPGVPIEYPAPHPVITMAKENNIPIFSDVDLFLDHISAKKFIGVTGTNGKSTTVSLIYHILRESDHPTELGGNIGIPILDLPEQENILSYVLELSSYQLELMRNKRINMAILLNITPDHLDRHGSFENYIAAKKKIFANQTYQDYAIINVDQEVSGNIYHELNASSSANIIPISTMTILPDGVSYIKTKIIDNFKTMKEYSVGELENLAGEHNKLNIAAAFAACLVNGVEPKKIIENLKTFVPLSHRMEYVANRNNITYINDSKSTNPISASCALKTYKNIFWIAGGKQKSDNFSELDNSFANVKKAYLIGEAQGMMADYLKEKNIEFEIMTYLDDAFKKASEDASNVEDSVVLLSPACASFDQFRNFEERGNKFKQLVKRCE